MVGFPKHHCGQERGVFTAYWRIKIADLLSSTATTSDSGRGLDWHDWIVSWFSHGRWGVLRLCRKLLPDVSEKASGTTATDMPWLAGRGVAWLQCLFFLLPSRDQYTLAVKIEDLVTLLKITQTKISLLCVTKVNATDQRIALPELPGPPALMSWPDYNPRSCG